MSDDTTETFLCLKMKLLFKLIKSAFKLSIRCWRLGSDGVSLWFQGPKEPCSPNPWRRRTSGPSPSKSSGESSSGGGAGLRGDGGSPAGDQRRSSASGVCRHPHAFILKSMPASPLGRQQSHIQILFPRLIRRSQTGPLPRIHQEDLISGMCVCITPASLRRRNGGAP